MERVQRRVMTKSMSLENTVLEEILDLFVFLLKKEWLIRDITGFQAMKNC